MCNGRGGRGLGGRVQSGDDLSVACGDSSPERGAFSFRCGGATSQALRRQLPFARGAKGLTGISFCSSCRREKEGTLFWQFMGRMM